VKIMALSPRQEVEYALDWGLPKEQMSKAAQALYDKVAAERRDKAGVVAVEPAVPARSSPEVRARILEMIKRANPKYAKPFERDRLAGASFVGTESWAEYGQVVLQMAILDTLLSIEELLSKRGGDGELAPNPGPTPSG
jgi:hypothetical protein